MKSTTAIRQRPDGAGAHGVHDHPPALSPDKVGGNEGGRRGSVAPSPGGGGERNEAPTYLRLKGQLIYIKEWNSLVYLATPT